MKYIKTYEGRYDYDDLIFKYSLVKKKLVFGKMIDVYTSTWYTKSEIINIKEDRKLKLKKINESR